MFGLGWQEMLVILLVVLLLFGAKRLPEIAKGLGKGIREFKGAVKDTQKEIQTSIDEDDKTKNSNNN